MFGPKWQEGRIEAIEKRLDKLDHAIEDLKRERRAVLTEWETTFEKFNALWARLSRRMKRTNGPGRAPDGPTEPAEGPPPMNPLAARLLIPGGR